MQKRKRDSLEEGEDQQKRVKFDPQTNVKQASVIDAKYDKSLQRFIENTTTNQKKNRKCSSKLIEFVPLSNCRKRKFVSKVRNRNNKLVETSF